MRRDAMSILRCPACSGQMALARPVIVDDLVETGELTCGCGESFAVTDGIPDLVFPRGQAYGQEDADTYDRDIAFIARFLNEDEGAVRSGAADLLGLKPGGRVLEVACGTGPNLPYLQERVGAPGMVYAFDISPTMVRAAARRAAGSSPPVGLLLGNGVHLPFADGVFDAVLHIGTLNRFSDVPRALAEMARVVKVGGKVLAADEGLGPWLVPRDYGAVLMRFGGLFKGAPPLAAIPPNAEQVVVRWLMGHAYFGIEFRVGARPPELNLDVPLPGRTVTVRDVIEATRAKEQR